jgi:Xaa-Pro aminopeptidase
VRQTRMAVSGLRLLAAALLLLSGTALALDYQPLTPDPAAFKARREKFMAMLPPDSIAILRSAPMRNMTNDVEYTYRPNSDFYYLTGIEEDDVTAVFLPNAADGKKYVLFLRPRDLRREAWAGVRVGPDEAPAAYGADAAYPLDQFRDKLFTFDRNTYKPGGYLAGVKTIVVLSGDDDDWWSTERDRLDPLHMERGFGPGMLTDARKLIHEMRLIKDAEDLRMMRRAAEISARGHRAAMAAAAPGKWEFEVQNALDSYVYSQGARRMAYPSIAGSGPNSCILHYDKSSRQIKDGEVFLNDSGAEYGYYATDVTRTYPVNGKFSPEQKAIYEIALAAQKAAMALVKPGATHDDVEQTCARVQTEGLVKLGLLQGDPAELVKTFGHRKLTLHGVSHWVGLDVHDPSSYTEADGKSSRVFKEGMVFTIEPGIYIPAKTEGIDPKWWNIGVRIEDTVLVTKDGFDCLSCGAPREVADVEAAVKAGKKR